MATFYVAPGGSGDGSLANPWGLQTAFDHPDDVWPGDTIQLRGGTYSGPYLCQLKGTAECPIVVQPYPGEVAVLDWNHAYTLAADVTATDKVLSFTEAPNVQVAGVIRIGGENMQVAAVNGTTVNVNRGWDGTVAAPHVAGATMRYYAGHRLYGDYTWLMGLIITNSYEDDRIWPVAGSNPPGRRRGELDVRGQGNKVINCIIHDTADGITAYSSAVDAELYGNIIYHGGWQGPDRLHGHALYVQNQTGQRLVREGIVFNTFDTVLSHYGSSDAFLDHFLYEGNVFFNGRFLWGGGAPVRDLTLRENHFYHSNLSTFELGYNNLNNDGAVLEGNTIVGKLACKLFKNVQATGNTWVNPVKDGSPITIIFNGTNVADYTFAGNTWYRNGVGHPYATFRVKFPGGPVDYVGWDSSDEPAASYGTTDTWQDTYGYDLDGAFITTPPAGAWVFLRLNEYDPNRAHVIIYNWDGADEVTIPAAEIEKVLSVCDRYRIRNAQDYFNDYWADMWGGGDVTVNMVERTAALPLAYTALKPSTFPAFGVFVLEKLQRAEV